MRKSSVAIGTFQGLGVASFQTDWKKLQYTWSAWLFFGFRETIRPNEYCLWKVNLFFLRVDSNPANIHLDEGVLKTCWRRLSSLSSEDVFKTSSSRRIYSLYSYVFGKGLDQDKYIRLGHTSSIRLQDVFKMSSRRLHIHLTHVFRRRLEQDQYIRLSHTSSRRL